MERFVAALLERNKEMNLTAARDARAVWEHVEDSLSLARWIDGRYVDVGSGGGFPAIPLAIVTGYATTLIESTAKKARFLAEVVRALGLDARVLPKRSETVAHDPAERARYRCATARAVGPAATVLELTVPFLEPGGRALLQRGEAAAGEEESLAGAALVLGAELEEEVRLSERRRVLVFRKIKETSARFPRKAGRASKQPLCT